MADEPGATLEQWHHWSETLGLVEHLLPVVANHEAEVSPASNMKALGKTPSHYNFRGQVAGIAKWTEARSTMKQVGKWELNGDYGISIQSREGGLQAIDIDVAALKRSAKIVAHVENFFPHLKWWRRSREGTGKVLLPFRVEGLLTKRVLKVDGGIIEILGDGQQWIADSTYLKENKPLGRYLWPAGRPPTIDDVPLITMAQLEELCADLDRWFGEAGGAGWTIARQRREGSGEYSGAARDDEIGAWLLEHWDVRGEKGDGTLFAGAHGSTSTAWTAGPARRSSRRPATATRRATSSASTQAAKAGRMPSSSRRWASRTT